MFRILVVDDDESLREMLFFALKKIGYDVVVARNGKEALKVCDATPPDLVLVDIIMPEKDGLETIRELRRMNPPVKIIAMSGGGRNDLTDYLKIAKQMGAACTLNKPFTNQTLAEAIKAVITPTESPPKAV